MPGFKLAKKVYEIFQQNPKVQGRIKKKTNWSFSLSTCAIVCAYFSPDFNQVTLFFVRIDPSSTRFVHFWWNCKRELWHSHCHCLQVQTKQSEYKTFRSFFRWSFFSLKLFFCSDRAIEFIKSQTRISLTPVKDIKAPPYTTVVQVHLSNFVLFHQNEWTSIFYSSFW